jgi:hypothetical protein
VFGRAPIAAVVDMDLSHTGVFRHAAPMSAGGFRTSGYFNAGFMVFESRNWRGQEFREKYAAALDQHDICCVYKIDCTSIDQCALNVVFEDNWIKLPASYNMQGGAKFTASWKTASVRHYCGARKFLPISAFRNDGRDVRYLNTIRGALGMPRTPFPFLYEVLFRLNMARKFRSDFQMRQFLRGLKENSPQRSEIVSKLILYHRKSHHRS